MDASTNKRPELVFVEECDEDGSCYRILSPSEEISAEIGLPFSTVAQPALVVYRSVGIGAFGAVMRWVGMPLEKIALFMNSSQVSGSNQFRQAVQLTFKEGALAPYRVVGPASITAWFMQYSVMGVAFQFFDQALSNMLQVKPIYYGKELMEPAPVASPTDDASVLYQAKLSLKTVLSPIMAACLESFVSNRAEAQRYFGPQKFADIERRLAGTAGSTSTVLQAIRRTAGPAYLANAGRNVIMCQTSFILTPMTYKLYFPQEQKSKSTLFWYGLGLNIFVGNVVAITQQALWGRSLDYLNTNGRIQYRMVIQQGLTSEAGMGSFFTVPKWFSRVLMNAPAQGTLPWFYNEILPLGELSFLCSYKTLIYDNWIQRASGTDVMGGDNTVVVPAVLAENIPRSGPDVALRTGGRPCDIQRTRTHYGTLPTANPEFLEREKSQRR